MYIQREGTLGQIDLTSWLAPIGQVGGDWLKKQLGMPTSAEEQAKARAEELQAKKELAKENIKTQAEMQKYMIYAGAGLLGVAVIVFVISMQKPRMIPVKQTSPATVPATAYR